MGAEQSCRGKRKESDVAKDVAQHLLNTQLREYERQCHEYIDDVFDAVIPQTSQVPGAKRSSRDGASSQSSAQASNDKRSNVERHGSPYSNVRDDVYSVVRDSTPTAPYYNHPGPSCSSASAREFRKYHPKASQHFDSDHTRAGSLERQRSPYSFVRDDVSNLLRESSPASNSNNPSPSYSSVSASEFGSRNYNQSAAQRFESGNRNRVVGRSQSAAPPRSGRDRSKSRCRNKTDEDELNCPTCRKMFSLQIYQCNSGHSSCNTCKERRRPCGICGNDITTMRNITLEAYIAEMKVPCPHKSDGCSLVIKMADMSMHVKACPFSELQCPLRCAWKGKLEELSVHFDSYHPQQRTVDVDSEIRFQNITNNSQNTYLVLIGAYNFLFHVKVSRGDRKIYMTAQLIGTKISAAKWSYEIHVYNKNECRRKYTYIDVCGSFIEPVEDVFKEGRCSVLPQAYASTFVHNGALTYKFFLKKTDENKQRVDFKNQRGKGRK